MYSKFKNITSILLLFSLLLGIISCKDDDNTEATYLELSISLLTANKRGIDENGNELTFTVNSNTYWLAQFEEEQPEWISLSLLASAAGETEVTVTFEENTDAGVRKAVVNFETLDDVKTSLTIQQNGTEETLFYFKEDFGTTVSDEVALDEFTPSYSGMGVEEVYYLGENVFITSSNSSASYSGASGGNNLKLTGEAAEFTVRGINLLQDIDLKLIFGVTASSSFTSEELKLQLSQDGRTWTDALYYIDADNSGTVSYTGWQLAEFPFILSEEIEYLYIRFENTTSANFFIDDIILQEGDGSGEIFIFSVDEGKGGEGEVYLDEDFSWLNYGNEVWYTTTGETVYSSWTADEKAKGWTVDGNYDEGYVYARPGFLKLGKTSYRAAIVSPALSSIGDSKEATVKVTFDATAYMSATGAATDFTELEIVVMNGGTIEGSASYMIDMMTWNEWATYEIYIENANSSTQIKFRGGRENAEQVSGGKSNRFFLDNVRVVEWIE
ncbi:MAG: BACON domain-containing protein [Odoribacter sp.]|nr:BACON domain-containing protein [Odoribacter sp.]